MISKYYVSSELIKFHKSISVFSFEGAKTRKKASADSAQEPPVPMPNTEVKLSSAENTWVATPREDR